MAWAERQARQSLWNICLFVCADHMQHNEFQKNIVECSQKKVDRPV